jgi:hypothetical protein
MSFYLLGSYILSACLIVHCMRTGRNTVWIWVLLMLPGFGGAAYIVAEILPELFGSRTAKRTFRGVKKALDPGQDLRRYETAARVQGGVAAQQRYAEELLRQGRALDAVEVYRQALKGLYEHDPGLMLGMAQAQFSVGRPADARQSLDDLILHNPDFKSPDGHLLYARALEAEGNTSKALDEYRTLAGYYAGAEAPLRYAQLLRREGRVEDARKTLRDLMDHAQHAPRHYRKTQAEWLTTAERELAAL